MIVDNAILIYNKNMNLLGNILKSSQRGRPRPWYSHRYIGRMLLVAIGVFAYEYNDYTQARSFEDILTEGTLHVGYIKAPDVAFETGHQQFGFQHDILSIFAEHHSLNIKLHRVSKKNAMIGLNSNRFDILIGHYEKRSSQTENPFSAYMSNSFLNALLTSKDYALEKATFENVSEFNNSKRNWRPYHETDVWYSSNVVLIEYKKPKTPRTQRIPSEEAIFYNAGFPIELLDSSNLNLQSVQKKPLLESVSENDIQYALTTSLRLNISQKFISRLRKIKTFKEKVPLVWLVAKNYDASFLNAVNTFINQDKTKKTIVKQANYWRKSYRNINALDVTNIHKRIHSNLSELRPLFKSAGEQENIDWALLAALAFQESNWKLEAVSPTRVRGVMQLTQATAELLEVKDRTDPNESIHAAARYLKRIEKGIPISVKRKDRIWLAVAAYNLGPGRINQAYNAVRAKVDGEITWNLIANELTTYSELFQNDQYSCLLYTSPSPRDRG